MELFSVLVEVAKETEPGLQFLLLLLLLDTKQSTSQVGLQISLMKCHLQA